MSLNGWAHERDRPVKEPIEDTDDHDEYLWYSIDEDVMDCRDTMLTSQQVIDSYSRRNTTKQSRPLRVSFAEILERKVP